MRFGASTAEQPHHSRHCGWPANGYRADIACEKGRLTITIAKEQKYEALQERFQREKIEIV